MQDIRKLDFFFCFRCGEELGMIDADPACV